MSIPISYPRRFRDVRGIDMANAIPVYNAAVLGADTTGATDATTAMQQALNLANANGGIPYFPEGIYSHRDLTLYNNLTVLGAGQHQTEFRARSGTTRMLGSTANLTGVTIRDIFVNGNGNAQYGIDLDHDTLGASTLNRVEDVLVQGTTVAGLTLANNGDTPLVRVTTRSLTSGAALIFDNPGGNIGLDHCYFFGGRVQLGFQVCNATGCTFTGIETLTSADKLNLIGGYVYSSSDTGSCLEANGSNYLNALSSVGTLWSIGSGHVCFDKAFGHSLFLVNNTWVATAGTPNVFGAAFDSIAGTGFLTRLRVHVIGGDAFSGVTWNPPTAEAYFFYDRFLSASGVVDSYHDYLSLKDGITAPDTLSGHATIYVDSGTGDLMVKFGDGVTKTLATDT